MKKAEKKETAKKQDYIDVEATEDITVRVYPPEGKRARASLVVETSAGKLCIYGNAMNGKNGWFYSYPQYKGKDGEYHNLVFALDKEVNDAISNALEEGISSFS